MKKSQRITWHLEKDMDGKTLGILAQLSKHYGIGLTVTAGQGVYDGEVHRMVRIEHVMPDGDLDNATVLARTIEHELQWQTGEQCVMPVIDEVIYGCSCNWAPEGGK